MRLTKKDLALTDEAYLKKFNKHYSSLFHKDRLDARKSFVCGMAVGIVGVLSCSAYYSIYGAIAGIILSFLYLFVFGCFYVRYDKLFFKSSLIFGTFFIIFPLLFYSIIYILILTTYKDVFSMNWHDAIHKSPYHFIDYICLVSQHPSRMYFIVIDVIMCLYSAIDIIHCSSIYKDYQKPIWNILWNENNTFYNENAKLGNYNIYVTRAYEIKLKNAV